MITCKDTEMRFTRISALVAATALLLTACNKQDDEQAVQAAAQNPLLAHVPADTPYLLANLEPTPAAVVDAYLARFGPSIELAQTMFDDITIEVNADGTSGNGHAPLLAAILAELDGKLSREGFESLGFSLESNKAFYGMGVFPVARIGLKDADALRAAIGRIESASGMSFPSSVSGDAEYWRLTDDSEQGGIYIAILADHVALGMFPATAEAEFLPAFLGQTMPQDSFGNGGALAQFNREKGFTNYGSGFVDMQKLAAEFLDGNSTTMNHLKGLHDFEGASLDPVCVAEIKSMLALAPRFNLGTTELTANAVAIKYQLELDAALAGQLADLVADVPVADDSADKMIAASLGIRAGRLRELLLEKATAMSEAPFQCSKLAGLNKGASDALTQMNRPMPPFVGNLNGFRLSLDEVDLENPSPENAKGMFALEVEKPQMLVGMAQMFVPGVDELGLEPGSDPVELPQEVLSMTAPGMHVYAAMSKDSIGLAVGADQQAGLAEFMDESGDNEGTFFSVSYDMAAHLEFQRKMRSRFVHAGADEDSDSEEFNDMLQKLEAMENSYRDMLGRARLDLRFTPTGLEIESRMTFK
jgi:hypothetical protein